MKIVTRIETAVRVGLVHHWSDKIYLFIWMTALHKAYLKILKIFNHWFMKGIKNMTVSCLDDRASLYKICIKFVAFKLYATKFVCLSRFELS